MAEIWFAGPEDAAELVKALEAEGYTTAGRARDDESTPGGGWALSVEPFDERVTDMVDVYGGWLPGDPRL